MLTARRTTSPPDFSGSTLSRTKNQASRDDGLNPMDLTDRQPLPDLTARFRYKKSLFRKEMVETRLFGLDQYGCILKTDKVFEPGDTIQFDLVMKMPFENISAEGLEGLVVEVRKHCSNFFYSLDFLNTAEKTDADMRGKLERIQEVLARKQTLKSRREQPGTTGATQTA